MDIRIGYFVARDRRTRLDISNHPGTPESGC